MSDENIKLFDMYAGYAFEKLYKSFPLCIELIPNEELIQIHNKDTIDENKALVFCSTLLWLEKNGFIRIASTTPQNRSAVIPMVYSDFMCVELTLNGLNLLTSPTPQTLNKKSVGDEIAQKVKSGMFTEAGKIATRAMFEFGVKKVVGDV